MQNLNIFELSARTWNSDQLDMYPIKDPSPKQIIFLDRYNDKIKANKPYSYSSGQTNKPLHITDLPISVELIKHTLRIKKQVLGVGVTVDVSKMKLFFTGSIFSEKTCSSEKTNHSMLLVGYNEKNEWVLKNSWGNKYPKVTTKIIEEFPIYKNRRCYCGGQSNQCDSVYITHYNDI